MSKHTVGPWAKDKLDRLREYLSAYTTIMSTQPWCQGFHYIDAFAGPGSHVVRHRRSSDSLESLINEAADFARTDPGQREFLAGSPRVALEIDPPFSTYVFVEKSEERAAALESLEREYPGRQIRVRRTDCNSYLRQLVTKSPKAWKLNRAIVFLDPFGMQVPWETIELLAKSQAIEIFVNFPVGMAIQRLLLRSGEFTGAQRRKLDEYLGSAEWYEVLYSRRRTLFGDDDVEKVEASGKKLVKWYQGRLKAIFGHVSRTALIRNTKGGHLYYLILASPKATAKKIADHVLSAGEYV